MTKQAHIFLSYADADRKFVSKIASELTKIGVLSYGLKLEAGGKIFGKIKKELTSADLFVFVVPSQEGEGRWALAEMGAARALNKNILGILPDRARYANSSFLKQLTDRPLVDATGVSPSALANTIVSSASAH